MSEIFHPEENHITVGDRNGGSQGEPEPHRLQESVHDVPTTLNKPFQPGTTHLINTRPQPQTPHTNYCNMSKHRTIEARPHLLLCTPQHAPPRSKSWHTRFSKKPPLARRRLSDSQGVVSVNGNASDSDASVFTNDYDTSSVMSDTVSSVLNESDFKQTLTLAFKPPSDDELVDINHLDNDNSYAALPYGKSSVSNENLSLDSEATSLADDTSILEQAELKLMSLPDKLSKAPTTTSLPDVSADQASDITNFSCSSMSMDQDGLLLSDQPSKETLPEFAVLQMEKASLESEIHKLKQSLKLSEADTAILVSAKQQLQLDLHDAVESAKSCRHQLQKVMVSSAQHEKSIIVLKATLEKEREKYGVDLELAKEQLDKFKDKLDKVSQDFDQSLLEKGDMNLENRNLQRELETVKSSNRNLQKEIDQVVSQNAKLNSMVMKSNADNAGNQEYMDIVRSERDEYVKRLHEKDHDVLQQQMLVRRLEERLSQLNEVNLGLSAERDDLRKSSQDQSLLVTSLKAQLALKFSEKEALDGAVSRLHGDLHKVEAGFTKIKQEIALKSGFAEKEHTLNRDLNEKVRKLEDEVEQLHLQGKVHTQRISDKNNQIVQLLNQLKATKSETSTEATEVLRLKSKLNSMEKKWTEVVEKEKLAKRDSKQKSLSLAESEKKCQCLNAELKMDKNKISEMEIKMEEMDNSLQTKFGEVECLQQKLQESESKCEAESKMLLAGFEQEKMLLTATNKDLSKKIDELQKQLVSQGSGTDQLASNQQMELVAELQESRRQLAAEVAMVRQEKQQLKLEHEKQVEGLIGKLNEKHAEYLKMCATESEKQNRLNEDVAKLRQNLAEQREASEQLKLKLSQTTDQYTHEAQNFAQLEEVKNLYAKEIAALQSKNQNLKEELATVKQEMNINAMKLMEDLQRSSSYENAQNELETKLTAVNDERDKLKEAVGQQQRYIVALQAHYQQWAKSAAAQIQQSQDAVRQSNKPKQAASSQTDHAYENSYNTMNPTTAIEAASQTVADRNVAQQAMVIVEGSSQTDHENELVHMTKSEVILVEGSSQTDHDHDVVHVMRPEVNLAEGSSQTDFDHDMVHVKRPEVNLAEGSSQTDHDHDLVPVTKSDVVLVEGSSQIDHNHESVHVTNSNVILMKGSSQTDHDNELVHKTKSDVVLIEGSSQTDHDSELLHVTNSNVILIEGSSQTDHNKLVYVTKSEVILVEGSSQTEHDLEFIHAAKSGVILVEGSSQTDHNHEEVHVIKSEVTLLEGSSQTDHDSELVHRTKSAVTLVEESSQTDHEQELVHMKNSNIILVEGSSQTDHDHDVCHVMNSNMTLVEGSSQTYHDHEMVHVTHSPVSVTDSSTFKDTNESFSSNYKAFTRLSTALVDNFTQTDHDEKPISSSPYKTRPNGLCSKCHVGYSCDSLNLQPYNSNDHCEANATSASDINGDNDSSYMSHESMDMAAAPFDSSSTRLQCARHISPLHADASTQTEHDMEPILTRRCESYIAFEESELNRPSVSKELFKTPVVTYSYSPVVESALTLAPGPFQSASTQTDHEFEAVGPACLSQQIETDFLVAVTQTDDVNCSKKCTQTDSITHTSSVAKSVNSSAQTDYNDEIVGKVPPKSLKTDFTGIQSEMPHHGLCKNCSKLLLTERCHSSVPSQTEESHLLPTLPNPQEVAKILTSRDAAKLKAYKRTVNVLKRKLQSAQDEIADQEIVIKRLEADLASLRAVLSSKEDGVQEKTGESKGDDRLAEELKHWRGVAQCHEFENTALKTEIEKLTQSFNGKAQKQKSKFAAQRILQEKKLEESNGRVVALIGANEKLRKSVEKLQVKLTTCSSQLETAQREKLRYQNRARKLQANLRSLSWLSTSGSEGAGNEGSITHVSGDGHQKKCGSLEMPSGVKDIEALLSTLKCEISSLERQLNDHNEVVNQSKATWREWRRPLSSESRNNGLQSKDSGQRDWLGEIV